MYAIALIRFRFPAETLAPTLDTHRAYLRGLKESGELLASGPFDPRTGGAVLLRVPDDSVNETLNRIRDNDPYIIQGLAQWELIPWNPVIGKEDLDRL